MRSDEFAHKQVGRLDEQLREVRLDIERLMQHEELLLGERQRWLGEVGILEPRPWLPVIIEGGLNGA